MQRRIAPRRYSACRAGRAVSAPPPCPLPSTGLTARHQNGSHRDRFIYLHRLRRMAHRPGAASGLGALSALSRRPHREGTR